MKGTQSYSAPADYIYLGDDAHGFGMFCDEANLSSLPEDGYQRKHTAVPATPDVAAGADRWRFDFIGRKKEQMPPEMHVLLAQTLGLPFDGEHSHVCPDLELLPIDWIENDGFNRWAWVFSEKNAAGLTTCYTLRYKDGRKIAHGPRGLIYGDNWSAGDGPILCPEGASDVLCLRSLGLAAVGRPNNSSLAEQLAELLAQVDPTRPIMILGENDQKPDGKWPGKEGAELVAKKISDILRRPVSVAFPPSGYKDVRDWYRQCAYGSSETSAQVGHRFLKLILPAGDGAATSPVQGFSVSKLVQKSAVWTEEEQLALGKVLAEEHEYRRGLDEQYKRAEKDRQDKEQFSTIDVRALPRAPKCGLCKLLYNQETGYGQTIKVRCGCWECMYCRELNCRMWFSHTVRCLQTCREIHWWRGPQDDAATITTRIRRKFGKYRKIKQPRGECLILANVSFKGSTAINFGDAREMLKTALQDIPFSCRRPVDGCRAWALPKDNQKKEVPLVDMGVVSDGDLDYLKDFFHKCGIAVQNGRTGSRSIERFFSFQLPDIYKFSSIFNNLRGWLLLEEVPPNGDLRNTPPEPEFPFPKKDVREDQTADEWFAQRNGFKIALEAP